MSRVLLTVACGLFICSAASAQELHFEFNIDGQMSGNRPWDGTGISSAAIDNDGGPMDDIPFLGPILNGLPQAGLDQFNDRIAPPDPYICVIASEYSLTTEGSMFCSPMSSIKHDTTQVKFNLGASHANEVFGVVLLDSDIGSAPSGMSGSSNTPMSGGSDDMIGFGIFAGKQTMAEIMSGNQTTLAYIRRFEDVVTGLVNEKFGVSRAFIAKGRAQLELAKVSVERCASGCRFGDATLTIRDGVDGW